MEHESYFQITENSLLNARVLTGYTGPGGDVVVPEGIDYLDGGAFGDRSDIRSVILPEGFKGFYTFPFYGCTGLVSLSLPRSMDRIENYFGWNTCPNLQQIIVAPGHPRYRSADGMLLEGSSLLFCPPGKTEAEIPEGVERIETGAFQHCRALTRVSLPEGLKEIGENAFSDCPALTSISLPKTVEQIGTHAFHYCGSLTEISVDPENPRYRWAEGVLYDGQDALRCPGGRAGAVTIAAGTKKIAWHAFSGCANVTEVLIPDSVTSIGTQAFQACDSLKRLILPPKLKRISNFMATGCSALQELKIPNEVTEIGTGAFQGCAALTQLQLPQSLTQVKQSAFEGCAALEQLTMFRSTALKIRAFANCGLRALILKGRGKKIEIVSSAFTGCGRLERVEAAGVPFAQLPKGVVQDIAVCQVARQIMENQQPPDQEEALRYIKSRRKSLVPLAIAHQDLLQLMFREKMISPKEVQLFLDEADARRDVAAKAALMKYQHENGGAPDPFAELEQEIAKAERTEAYLEKYGTLPVAELKKLWGTKKQRDGSLTIISYKGTDTRVTVPDKIGKAAVTAIGPAAFSPQAPRLTAEQKQARENLTAVIIPEGVVEIEDSVYAFRGAFSSCKNLEEISLPKGMKRIGFYAFSGCDALQSITLPQGLKEVGSNAFFGCAALKTVSLPDSLTALEHYVFEQCNSLSTIQLPAKLRTIGDGCFRRCRSLKEIALPKGLKEIGKFAFQESGLIKAAMTPGSCKTISYSAFRNCKDLAEVELPEGIETIEECAFAGCESLSSLTIPGSVKELPPILHDFEELKGLKELKLEEGVEKIHDLYELLAFHCPNLIRLTLPASLREILPPPHEWSQDVFTNIEVHVPAGSYAEQFLKDAADSAKR